MVEPAEGEPRIAAVILAAGFSGRMGNRNKLLCEIDGIPVVRRVADAVIDAKVDMAVLVTGHDAPSVAAAVAGTGVRLVHNTDYRSGMGRSLARGVEFAPQ